MNRVTRAVPSSILFVLLLLLYPSVAASGWRSSSDVHALLEFGSSLLALTAGLMVLIHFFATGRWFFLGISIGFAVIGAEEWVHAIFSFSRLWPDTPPTFRLAVSTTWLAGHYLLLASFFIAAWRGARDVEAAKRTWDAVRYGALALIVAAVVSLLIFKAPLLPDVVELGTTPKRLLELSVALLYLVAFCLYSRIYVTEQPRSPLLWSITAFLMIQVVAHVFVCDARYFYDAHWDAAHLLVLLSYFFPILGVWGDTIALHRSAQTQVGELAREIAERRKAEEALRQNQALLDSVVEGTVDAVYVKDAGGRYLLVNAAVSRIVGKTRDEILGKDDTALFRPDEAQVLMEGDRDVMASGIPRTYEEFVTTAEGVARTFLSNKGPLRDEQGQVIGLFGIARDITDLKRIEEEKDALASQLQQAQKMESVGRLAGGVAHDFNNMLGVILGRAEIALDGADPTQPLYADLEEIRAAATRSADLVRQLLAFARKQTIMPRVLDLNEIVTGTLKMLERLIGEDIHLRWRPGTDLWRVKADASQIDQILTNLCVNARDAIYGVGTISIETKNTSVTQADCAGVPELLPGEYVRLVVGDNGCGMDQETLARIFEPFFTTKGVGKGTGLGLASVYGAVKQNGGFIDARSEPGEGTSITIYLPRHAGKAGRPDAHRAAVLVGGGHETILLVEDEPSILSLTTVMLKRLGYTVLSASTPTQAIRLAMEQRGPIHLLMTDVVMPEMNGRTLARNLQAVHPNLKRLFMSGYTADIIADRGVIEGGVHFLQKPFSSDALAAKILEALESD
jgi:PAS domain S-box-containing protein